MQVNAYRRTMPQYHYQYHCCYSTTISIAIISVSLSLLIVFCIILYRHEPISDIIRDMSDIAPGTTLWPPVYLLGSIFLLTKGTILAMVLMILMVHQVLIE